MRRAYIGEAGAQLHYIEAGHAENETLILLPPSPNTSVSYEKIIPLLAKQHHVIAIDYPGFGGSDRIDKPSIANYAKAIAPLAEKHSPVALSGFHTGALVANELALLFPSLVHKLVLVDVPYFDATTRTKYAVAFAATELPSPIETNFKKKVTDRHESLTEDRAFKIWVESLRSGRYQNDAYRAAFSYEPEARFLKLEHPLTVIATSSNLLEPSRKIIQIVAHAKIVELLEITSPVFEAHSDKLAPVILAALKD